ncbi:MAG TPA: isochorismatase family cysteine hydrolase [Ignavibacteria bacterium]|nr:isochorismatase family cysteine hydrolase [Ignavibacteria bacterium]
MKNKIALINIDMQKIYLENIVSTKEILSVCEYINYTADILRSKNLPVIHIKDIENINDENREMYEIISDIKISKDELIIEKKYSNSFWNTDLENVLKSNGVNFLILCGFSAENCVLFTYNGAIERDFKPVILQNGILSSKNDIIQSTYRDREIISYSAVQYICDQLF